MTPVIWFFIQGIFSNGVWICAQLMSINSSNSMRGEFTPIIRDLNTELRNVIQTNAIKCKSEFVCLFNMSKPLDRHDEDDDDGIETEGTLETVIGDREKESERNCRQKLLLL